MSDHRVVLGPLNATRRTIAMAGGGAASVLLALVPAAMADTYSVGPLLPWNDPILGIGTNGDDAPRSTYSVSQGGCAGGGMNSGIAVAIGESNRQCTSWYRWHNSGSEATGATLALGLGGADATSYTLAVTDSGDASGQCWTSLASWTGCDVPAAAVSVTGRAWGQIAVSGTGSATSSYDDSGYFATRQGVAASGGGPASADNPDSAAVSGIGNATAKTLAVAGFGMARSRGCSGDAVTDATSGYAVSVFGNAYGCTTVSVTGETGP